MGSGETAKREVEELAAAGLVAADSVRAVEERVSADMETPVVAAAATGVCVVPDWGQSVERLDVAKLVAVGKVMVFEEVG